VGGSNAAGTGGDGEGGDGNVGGSSNGGSGGEANGGEGNEGGTGGVNAGGSGGENSGGEGGTSSGGTGGSGGSGGSGNLLSCGMPEPAENPGVTCYNAAPPALKLTQVLAQGEIFAPVRLVSPPGDSERMFVVTREGIIYIIKNGTLLSTPFVDLSDETTNNSGEAEHGLLGMAFDPNFATNRKVWVHYNQDADPYISITASILVSEDNHDVADLDSLDPLFEVDQPYGNHKGGMIEFGPDHCLYVSFGDGGSQDDPQGNGQNTTEPLGAILRLDPTTGNGAIGNPGYADARIWMYGLRNPWRYSFDRVTGDMYIGDVGQGSWEEIDVAPAGTGDLNFGWDVLEGTHSHQGGVGTPGMRAPAREYQHGNGENQGNSVTGGYVYRGTAIPNLVGRYIYGDFKSSRFWTFTYTGENAGAPQICDQYEITTDLDDANGPTAFGEDANGELYILTLNGAIYRIDAE
jgi:glucose/arabinose dehydrogenase